MRVTCLIDTNGDAVERYMYDSYGKTHFLNADWSAGASSYDNSVLYCGYYRDNETGIPGTPYKILKLITRPKGLRQKINN